MSKNRNGKPTQFQLTTLKDLGYSGKSPKTYRDAENAIKRLRNASKKVVKSIKDKCSAKPNKAPKFQKPSKDVCNCYKDHDCGKCSKKENLANKDKADKLPTITGAVDVQIVRIPKIDLSEPDNPATTPDINHDDHADGECDGDCRDCPHRITRTDLLGDFLHTIADLVYAIQD